MYQKLINKFHFFDIIGITIFFSILAVAAFFFLRKADYVTLTLRVSESDSLEIWSMPPLWYTSYLKPGLTSKDMLGRPTIEVVDVYQYLSRESSSLTYVKLKVRAVYNRRTNEYSYNGSNLLIGSYQQFKVQGLLLTGVVHSINSSNLPDLKKFLIKGYVSPILTDGTALSAETISTGVPLFISKKIREGLTVTDASGTTLAQIKKVHRSPAQRRFLSNGQFTQVNDPTAERVEVEVAVLAEKNRDLYFFRQDSPLIINSSLYLLFGELQLPIQITDIQPIEE